MNRFELRAVFALTSILSIRMLGLFMILPIFSLYAPTLIGATPTLIGMALGIYGLTQAFFQLPLGILSDHLGRKPIIIFGLVIFAIGSMIAAASHSIYGVLLGRALQGAGAIGSTVIAYVADITTEEHRTKAMALLGMTIGLSFTLAMALGPAVNAYIHVSGIFWLTAVLSLLGIVLLKLFIPNSETIESKPQVIPGQLFLLLKDKDLIRLDLGVFILHAALTASFVVIPVSLEQSAGLPGSQQWHFYLPIILLAFLASVPFIVIADKRKILKPMMLSQILLLALAELLLWRFHSTEMQIAIGLFLFFSAFSFLEACLPSMISKSAPINCKGSAMGIFSTSQFFGIFVGGLMGGWLYGHYAYEDVYLVCGMLSLIWLLLTWRLRNISHIQSQMLHIGKLSNKEVNALKQQLLQINGITEAWVLPNKGIAYIKMDTQVINKDDIKEQLSSLISLTV